MIALKIIIEENAENNGCGVNLAREISNATIGECIILEQFIKKNNSAKKELKNLKVTAEDIKRVKNLIKKYEEENEN